MKAYELDCSESLPNSSGWELEVKHGKKRASLDWEKEAKNGQNRVVDNFDKERQHTYSGVDFSHIASEEDRVTKPPTDTNL